MTISATDTSTVSPMTFASDYGAGAVSPDTILDYCNAQMSQIDGSIDTLMKQQDDANNVSKDLNDINSQLQKYSDGYNVNGVGKSSNSAIGSTENKGDIEQMQGAVDDDYQNAIDAANLSGDGKLAAEIQTDKTNFDKTADTSAGGDDCLSAQEVSDTENDIKNAESDSSNNSQMVMISLQQLLSTRQQAISLTSNMLQTVDDTNKSVISNIHSS